MRSGFKRSDRVASRLHQVIAELFRSRVRDPSLDGVVITEVSVTTDLRYAKVYYLLIDEESVSEEEVRRGFTRVAGFVRSEAARRVPLRFMPELRFLPDEAVKHGRKMEQLLAELSTETKSENEESGSEGGDTDE